MENLFVVGAGHLGKTGSLASVFQNTSCLCSATSDISRSTSTFFRGPSIGSGQFVSRFEFQPASAVRTFVAPVSVSNNTTDIAAGADWQQKLSIASSKFTRAAVAVALSLSLWTVGPVHLNAAEGPRFTQDQVRTFTEEQGLLEERQLLTEAWAVVKQAYVDATFNNQNWQDVFKRSLETLSTDRRKTYETIRTMLTSLDDPYTRLLTPEQFGTFEISSSGDLKGIGLTFGKNEETSKIEVSAPIPGGPADRAGVSPKDEIIAINSKNIQGLSLDDIAALIRGPQGSSVTLSVRRGDEDLTFTMVREKIALSPIFAELVDVPNKAGDATNKIGYIYLREFTLNATKEMAKSIDDLVDKGAEGFVLDLRNNPGGVLDAGVSIARLFLEPGSPVVYTINRNQVVGAYNTSMQFSSTQEHEVVRAPLVVLVNRGSASASEILASALHDNCRAVLVGERTYGKGLVQAIYRLWDGSALAVTVAKYETPAHMDIHKKGIEPDVPFPPPNRPKQQYDLKSALTEVNPLQLQERLETCQRPADEADEVLQAMQSFS